MDSLEFFRDHASSLMKLVSHQFGYGNPADVCYQVDAPPGSSNHSILIQAMNEQ